MSHLRYNVIINIAGSTTVMVRQPVDVNLVKAAWSGLAQAPQHLITGKQGEFPEGWSCVVHLRRII